MIVELIESIYGENFTNYQIERFPEDSGIYIIIFDPSKSFDENLKLLRILKEKTINLNHIHWLIGEA